MGHSELTIDAYFVIIRTNSVTTTLNISAYVPTNPEQQGDVIHHYGNVGRVEVEKVDMHCYNEYGDAAYIKLLEGKVAAKAGGTISVIFAANNDPEAIAVIKESEGTIKKGLTVIQPVSDTNEARTNGIALEYSINGTDAAEMDADELAEELENREETIEELAAVAIDEMAAEEVTEDPNSENYVARVGANGYLTFAEAVEAAKAKGTSAKVIILADLELNSNVTLENEVVLNENRTLYFKNGSKITFTENGKFSLNGNQLNITSDGNEGCGFIAVNFNAVRNSVEESPTGATATIYKDFGYLKPFNGNACRYVYFTSGNSGHWGNAGPSTGAGDGHLFYYAEENVNNNNYFYDSDRNVYIIGILHNTDMVFNGDTLKFYLDEYTGEETYSWDWTYEYEYKNDDPMKLSIDLVNSEPDAALITFSDAEYSDPWDYPVTITLTGTTTKGSLVKTTVWEITYAYSPEQESEW